jgi:hypothetical protein
MRYKTAPGPVELVRLDTLEAAHAALPLVPEEVDDCCARVVERTAVPDREDAREWITLMQALGLAEKTPRGYRRVQTDLAAGALADGFAERVFGVAELLDALEGAESLTPEEAFERLWPSVPAWERDRHADPERVWTGRVQRLLAWSVVFGLASQSGNRYAVDER